MAVEPGGRRGLEALSEPKPRAHWTIHGYHNTVSLFLAYLTDARFGWADLLGSALTREPAATPRSCNSPRNSLPVLADLLGIHIVTADRWARATRAEWTTYAAIRSPNPPRP